MDSGTGRVIILLYSRGEKYQAWQNRPFREDGMPAYQSYIVIVYILM